MIAKILIEQLGSQALQALGVQKLVGFRNGLVFGVQGSPAINTIVITLDPDDTYRVEFWKADDHQPTQVSAFSCIYCDQLHDLIAAETGLPVSL